MPRTKEQSFCCGAGGARMWMEETLGTRVNTNRTEEAIATGAERIAIGCPFCRVMISDGVTAKQAEGEAESVEVVDVAQMLLGCGAPRPAGHALGSDADDVLGCRPLPLPGSPRPPPRPTTAAGAAAGAAAAVEPGADPWGEPAAPAATTVAAPAPAHFFFFFFFKKNYSRTPHPQLRTNERHPNRRPTPGTNPPPRPPPPSGTGSRTPRPTRGKNPPARTLQPVSRQPPGRRSTRTARSPTRGTSLPRLRTTSPGARRASRARRRPGPTLPPRWMTSTHGTSPRRGRSRESRPYPQRPTGRCRYPTRARASGYRRTGGGTRLRRRLARPLGRAPPAPAPATATVPSATNWSKPGQQHQPPVTAQPEAALAPADDEPDPLDEPGTHPSTSCFNQRQRPKPSRHTAPRVYGRGRGGSTRNTRRTTSPTPGTSRHHPAPLLHQASRHHPAQLLPPR